MRAAGAFLAALVLASAGAAGAAALSVTPIRLTLTPAAPLGTFQVINEGATAARAQLTLNQWTQTDGKDILTPVRDVLVNPTIFEVAGNSRQLVRLGLQVPAQPAIERSYRLIVDEIPGADQLKAGTIGVRLRISVPLFVPVDGAKAVLGWKAAITGTAAHLSISNSGGRHAQILRLKILSSAGTSLFDGSTSFYVLPGATMPTDIKLTAPAKPGETLRFEAHTDDGDVTSTIRADAS